MQRQRQERIDCVWSVFVTDGRILDGRKSRLSGCDGLPSLCDEVVEYAQPPLGRRTRGSQTVELIIESPANLAVGDAVPEVLP